MTFFRDIENKSEENDLCKQGKAPWFLFCFTFIVIYSFIQLHSFELLPLCFSKGMYEKSYNMKIGCNCLISISDTQISKFLTYMMNNYKICKNLQNFAGINFCWWPVLKSFAKIKFRPWHILTNFMDIHTILKISVRKFLPLKNMVSM